MQLQDYSVAVLTFLLLIATPFHCSSFISGTTFGEREYSDILSATILCAWNFVIHSSKYCMWFPGINGLLLYNGCKNK